MSALGFSRHNHSACIAGNLAAAEDHCRKEGLKLTPVRRRVLEALLQEHRALGAYEILDILRSEGHAAQPPVAYRALDFLVSNGFAHRIEKLNAFVACAHPGSDHAPAFLICRLCQGVAETQTEIDHVALNDAAEALGFRIERSVVEAEGVCPNCKAKESAPA